MAQIFDNDPLQEFVTKEVALSKLIGTPEETDFKRQRDAEREAMPKYKSERLPYITYDDITTEGDMYDPLDFPTVSQRIRDNVLKAIVSRFPVQGEQYTVKVENPHYETPRNTRIKDERDAILQQKSISDRLRGDLVLIDNKTGKELQRRTLTLVNVPRMTDRGTFIRNGAFIAMKHMFRLRPGVYTRIKGNGIVQAHINPKQGTGRQMSIELDPDSGVLNVHRAGRQYGLLPLLVAGGMPEDAIKKEWGDELYNMNKEKYKQLFVSGNKKMEDYKKLWDEELSPMLLDKETTQWTLGTPYESVQPAVLLRASNKILRIARNAGDPDAPDETDDRDGLQYQTVLGPADYIAERILRDGGGILRNTLNQITREGSLDKVQPGIFQPHVDSVFTEDKHTGYIDESSPLEVVYFNSGVSRLGEGGIGDTRAAPAESRGVQNSYVGFVDIIQSPECYDSNTEILTIKGWISVKDMTMDTRLACYNEDGSVTYEWPMHLTRVYYNGPMYEYHSKSTSLILAVTPNHRMWVHPADENEYRFMRADECAETPFLFVCDADGNEYELDTEGWAVKQYIGYVYCPTVRGGIVYVRRHGSRGIWCGNSLKVGLDNYLTHGVRKDDKGKLYTKMRMPNGQVKYVDMATVANSTYTTPEYFDPKADPNERIPAFVRGKSIEWVPRSNVNMYVADTSSMMSKSSGTVPLIGGIRSNRVLLGCLHPSTSIPIRTNGVISVTSADEILQKYDAGHMLELITEVGEDRKPVWTPIRGVYKRSLSSGLWRVKSANGHEVLVSGSHKWNAILPGCDSKQLIQTNNPSIVGAAVESGMFRDVDSELGHAYIMPPTTDRSKHAVAIPVTEDFAWLLGMIVAEGYVKRAGRKEKRPSCVQISACNSTLRDLIIKSAQDAGLSARVYRSKRYPDGEGVAIYNRRFALWVHEICGHDSDTVRVPNVILNSPIEVRRAFISGYYDGDGTITLSAADNYRLHSVTNSATLQADLLFLFASIGVCVKGARRKSASGKNIYYTIVRKSAYSVFPMFRHPHKRELLQRAVELGYKEDKRYLPKTGEIMSSLRTYMDTTRRKNYFRANGVHRYICDYSEDVRAAASPVINREWDIITSVTPVPESEWPEYLVDIDMNDSEYMLANGLFTHNSKYGIQAVPLVHREAPLVRRALPDDNGNPTTTERYLGKTLGARTTPVDGTVVSVDPDEIVVKGRDGQKHTIELYNNYILNQKGFLQNIPQVKPGDKVTANQVIASSNYTDKDGNAALGTNLRMAFMTGKDAGTFEDAITIAESVAKTKMASMQMYKARGSITPDIEYNKDKFIRSFGRRDFTKEQLDKLGDDGVAVEGTVLEKGDPIFVGVKTQDQSTRGIARNAVVPYVETWEHEYPGTVRTIAKGRKHFTAYIDAVTPMETGDKMCFDDKTEVFTDTGWKLFKDLGSDDRILTLDPASGCTYFTDFTAAYSFYHKGRMYSLVTPDLDICTTDNHRHLVARNCDCSYMKFMTSDEIIGKHVYHFVGMDADFGKPRFYKCSRAQGKTKEGWIQYDGYVYCLEVPYTHTLYVRRNGKCVWSGNSNRYGAKGVVRVVPDEQMPVDENGQMIEVLQSPLGLPSRINTAQVVEAQEGKIARLTGQPVELPDFMPNENLIDRTLRRLEEHGLKESETLYDPTTGKHIPDVETGVMFYYKLKHMADSKQGARSTGGYTVEEVPTKGGKEGCFVYDQCIETDQGYRKIGDIVERKESVNVRGYSKQNGWGWYPVVDWFKYSVPRDRIITVIAEIVSPHDESTYVELSATSNHEFYRADGTGILVKDIEPGMCLKTNSKRAIVTALKQTHGIHDYVNVYDIEVADVHNYVTYDVLVSNSRRLGGLEIGALLGGGGDELVRDAKLVRGQQNDEFWRSYMNGEIPDAPRTPLVHKKFFNHLKAAGVSIEPRGNKLHIYGASDKDIKNLTGARRVTNTSTFDSKQLRPVKGGLFDPSIFGADGDQWGYYELPEPVLNPLMFKPVAHMLGWKDKELEGLLRGERQINGKVGIEALEDVLSKLDLPKELRIAKATLKDNTAPLSKRDAALKKIRAIEPMIREHKTPSDMLWTRLPILPPAYRQVNTLADDVNIVADANFLYKRVMDAADDLREAKGVLPKEALMDARTAVYDTLDELVGLSDTGDPKLQAKNVGGLLKWAFGKGSPKLSSLHRKVFGATVDLGGRGTVVSDNSLSIDQLGIPEKTAWKLYEPQVVRRLRQRGFPMLDAIRNVTERTPEARRILDDVMKDMPVLMNRAPTLWEYGIRGFYPVIVDGDTTRVNPNVVGPFNMDFDGDSIRNVVRIAIQFKIPNQKSEKTVTEALKNMPRELYWAIETQNRKGDAGMFSADTDVFTAHTVMAIEDIPTIPDSAVQKSDTVTEWDVPEGFYVNTLDPADGKQVMAPITKVSEHRNVNMYHVTCAVSGSYKRIINASEDHSLITYNANTGLFEKTKPVDAVGRLIPRITPDGGNRPEHCLRYIDLGVQVPLSYKLGIIFGAIIADGWVDANDVVRIAANDDSIRETLMELTSDYNVLPTAKESAVFTYAPKDCFGTQDKKRITVYMAADDARKLKSYIGSGAVNKRIPWQSLGASRAHMLGLFVGLLSTDGAVNYSHIAGKKAAQKGINYSTSSPYLRDGIQELAIRLGVRSSVHVYRGTNSTTDCYMISFAVGDIVKLYNEEPKFRLIHEASQKKLEQIVEDTNNAEQPDTLDIVPYPYALFCELTYAGASALFSKPSVLTGYRNRGYMSREHGLKIANLLQSTDWSNYSDPKALPKQLRTQHTPEYAKALVDAWCELVRADRIKWTYVVSAEPYGVETAWDLTVPGPFTFALADGTIVQDTAALHVPVTKQAIEKVKAKMLPSRSLLSPQFNQVHYAPAQEFLQGLNLATRKGTNKPVRFRSEEEMLAALKRGDITYDTEYIIG